MSAQLLIDGPDGLRSVALSSALHEIGRHRRCAVRLEDEQIAAVHARLVREEQGGYVLLDAGAPAGTRVNGERIVRYGPLTGGDVVHIGCHTLRLIEAPPETAGLGPLEALLQDEEVTGIMVNGIAEVFVEREGRLQREPLAFGSAEALFSVIERIVAGAGRRVDEASPVVDARLRDGSRVNVVMPPLAPKGPAITIRRVARRALTPGELTAAGSLSPEMLDFLRVCVEQRRNLIVAGGPGSGKTTLLNVLSNLIPPGERLVTIEDAAELRLHHENLVALEARPGSTEGRAQVSMRELVRNALRMRPDRIIVGECRGAEALELLQAMNTGHEGSLTTAHASSPRDLLARLEVMVLLAGLDLPVAAIREQIASAVDVIVQQARFPCGTRRITRIVEVTGVEAGAIQTQDLFAFERSGHDRDGRTLGRFVACGVRPGPIGAGPTRPDRR